MTTNLKNCPLDALDRIDETIGLMRSCLNDPPELVAMNTSSMKADFDGILKDLRKYGAIWRGNVLSVIKQGNEIEKIMQDLSHPLADEINGEIITKVFEAINKLLNDSADNYVEMSRIREDGKRILIKAEVQENN